ncbi:MAG: DUF421 domain-containing protein [Clostridia bacterium]|nr:DUF421 domain-containing protein [Clostridia bacterium]
MLILIFRAIFLYLLVILVMRIMGKREIGQLQPYELAITLIISELVTLPMENNGVPLLAGIIPAFTITLTQLLLSYLTTKSQWLQDFISGRYTIMIENGKLIEGNLRKQKYNITELLEQLRMSGVMKIQDVQYAILETSGQLSVILKAPKQPVTAEQMMVNTTYEGLPINIILDGKLIQENLSGAKLTPEKVKEKLKEKNLTLEEVFYANVDATGEFFIQEREEEKKK